MHYYVSKDSFISNLDLSEELNFVRSCGQEKRNLDLITLRPLYLREKPSEEWKVKSRVCQAAATPHSKPKKKQVAIWTGCQKRMIPHVWVADRKNHGRVKKNGRMYQYRHFQTKQLFPTWWKTQDSKSGVDCLPRSSCTNLMTADQSKTISRIGEPYVRGEKTSVSSKAHLS